MPLHLIGKANRQQITSVGNKLSFSHLHCGYYVYNNKMYIDREDLLDDMLISEDDNRVYFYFNEDVFNYIDWTIEPDISLKELYRLRAQQLRDTYDYLILSYSGGSDSHEILMTFLENDIFIDEIQTVHHYSLIEKVDRAFLKGNSNLATLLEFEMAVLPVLQKVVEKSPKTKLKLIDASDYTVQNAVKEKKFSFMGIDGKKINTTFITQTTPFVRTFYQHHYNNTRTDLPTKVGFIRGTDKPNLKMNKNRLKFAFTDVTMHGAKLINKKQIGDVYTIENFYWNPEIPLIPIKQSHVIKKALENDANFYAMFMLNQDKSAKHVEFNMKGHPSDYYFTRKYNRYIYHYWNDQFYQAPKKITESGELLILDKLFNDTTYREVLKEQQDYTFKKYNKIDDKKLINRTIISNVYDVGELNVTWDN